MPVSIGGGPNNKVYLVYISPAVVVVKEELYVEFQHRATTYPFEVPEQEMTFGLPAGNQRVKVEKLGFGENFDTEGCKVFSVHDIVNAPELYGRLLAMAAEAKNNSSEYTAYDEYDYYFG